MQTQLNFPSGVVLRAVGNGLAVLVPSRMELDGSERGRNTAVGGAGSTAFS